MHLRRIRQLANEGAAMTLVVATGLVVGRLALNSATADRLANVPLVGLPVKGLQALFNATAGNVGSAN